MTTSTPVGSRGCSDLGRAIDGAVWSTRCGRLIAVGGVWLAAAAASVVVLAAVDLSSAGRLGIARLPVAAKLGIVLTVSAIPAAVWFWRRVRREGWPSRFAIAIATERVHARLGETLSRAVEFLETARAAESSMATTAADGFRQLAIDQAAVAVGDVGRLTAPGIRTDAAWAATGLAAAAAVWISAACLPGAWSEAVRRQLDSTGRSLAVAGAAATPTIAAPEPARPFPSEAHAAGIKLARAATIERRLADLLATLFAESAGVPASAVSRSARRQLDELAALHEDCLRVIASAREVLRNATAAADRAAVADHHERLRQALSRLDEVDQANDSASAVDIAANRLGLASEATAAVADAAAAAAAFLGVVPGPLAPPEIFGPGSARPLDAADAALDRIAARRDRDRSVAASAAGPRPASDGSRSPTDRSPSGSQPTGDAGAGAATADPAGGRAAADALIAVPANAAPLERVWSRLPTAERMPAVRAAADSLPPEYRSAVDAYYRALLQSSSDLGPPRPAAAPPSLPR